MLRLLASSAPGQPIETGASDEGVPLLIDCSCCGEPDDLETTATLQCHDDIHVCRACIGSLAQQAGMLDVTPTLPVIDMNKAVGFYEAAGFVVRRYDDGFVFVQHDEQSVFDLGLEENIDPQRNGAGCYIIVADVDAWHATFTNADLNVTAIETKPWGMREFTTSTRAGTTSASGRTPDTTIQRGLHEPAGRCSTTTQEPRRSCRFRMWHVSSSVQSAGSRVRLRCTSCTSSCSRARSCMIVPLTWASLASSRSQTWLHGVVPSSRSSVIPPISLRVSPAAWALRMNVRRLRAWSS